jgi:peptide/nickel transport system substrate-binding protein
MRRGHVGRRTAGRLGVLVLAVGLVACGGEKKAGQAPPPALAGARGGTVVVGVAHDFGPLNPVVNTDQYTDELIKYGLFTPLIQFDAHMNPQPYLARNWEMTGDTGIVFHLRHDVLWQDAQRVTAEDVKFTFDLAKDPATASLLADAYLSKVDRAEVVDSFTVRFHFSAPHAQAIQDFWWPPVPKHLLANVPPAELRNADFNRHPVGSGPFHLALWQANDQLVVEREGLFPGSLGGSPPLDRVVFRIIPEPATMMTEFMSGGVQVDLALQPEQVVQVRSTPTQKLFAYPGRTVYFIAWNNQRAPFNDPRVRRALTLAIDRKELTKALLYGLGEQATSPIPPWSALAPDIAPLPFDPRKAQSLLADAGYTVKPGGQYASGPDGQPLHVTLITSNRPFDQTVAQLVQAQLRGVGVQVEVQPLEFQTFLQQYRSREFDAAFANWQMDSFQLASAPYALFGSALAAVPGSSNRAGVASPKLDRLLAAAAADTSASRARSDWKAFVEELQAEQPFTFMFWWAELAGVDQRVQGVVMDPRGQLVSMKDWWLAPKPAP